MSANSIELTSPLGCAGTALRIAQRTSKSSRISLSGMPALESACSSSTRASASEKSVSASVSMNDIAVSRGLCSPKRAARGGEVA